MHTSSNPILVSLLNKVRPSLQDIHTTECLVEHQDFFPFYRPYRMICVNTPFEIRTLKLRHFPGISFIQRNTKQPN